ncbi:ABC transporter substrate-binding protein [Devosia pacifica]|uniref:ABC transporter substrate-binding protein n=1 Tax=Devosia pacifica TaxID=1335967 RepID=A0A918S6B4_9HYPH|nr:ABC transporter substrate-binding protein [Devosia pacifica]GHA26492.1 ABC transporter substrate-binding protein [Devosia pacifica]
MRSIATLLVSATLLLTGVTAVFAQADDITIAVALEPPALDPTAGAAEAIDIVTYQNIFEGLTRIDRDGSVQPGLASDWTISDDGLSYVFSLREDVVFHDGSTFDADDVAFTFERILADDSTNAQKSLYEVIEAVEVEDPQTVRFTLAQPSGRFLFDIGRGDAVIVASESAENNATLPIGTGPYAFVQWDRGSRVILERFDSYWGDRPPLARATIQFIGDTATLINALLAGEVDGTNNMAAEALEVFANNPEFQVLVGTTEGEVVLATNNRIEPFSDLKVRQAMAHAIDRDALIEGVTYGYSAPIGSHFAPHHPFYVDLTQTYPYDLERARTLLAEAGYEDGFSATLKLPPVGYARQSGQILASQFAEIGITLELINVEWAQWLEDVLTNHDYDLSIVAHVEPFDIGIYADPDYYFGYDNADFRELIETLNTTTDDAERRTLAEEAQRILAEDAVNGYLFELAQTGVWRAGLEGMWQDSPIEGLVLRDLRWSE